MHDVEPAVGEGDAHVKHAADEVWLTRLLYVLKPQAVGAVECAVQ